MFLFLSGYSLLRFSSLGSRIQGILLSLCVLSAINSTGLTGPLLVVYSTFQTFGPILTGLSTMACAIYCFIWSKACCCSGLTQVWVFSWWLGTAGSWADFIWVCMFTKILPFQIKFVSFYVCRWNHCHNLTNHVSMNSVAIWHTETVFLVLQVPSPYSSLVVSFTSGLISSNLYSPLGHCFPILWCHQHTVRDLSSSKPFA